MLLLNRKTLIWIIKLIEFRINKRIEYILKEYKCTLNNTYTFYNRIFLNMVTLSKNDMLITLSLSVGILQQNSVFGFSKFLSLKIVCDFGRKSKASYSRLKVVLKKKRLDFADCQKSGLIK